MYKKRFVVGLCSNRFMSGRVDELTSGQVDKLLVKKTE